MSTKRWKGGATPAVAQVDTFTVGGTVEAGDKFIITVTGEDGSSFALSVTASTTSTSTTATEIAAAWNASVNPLLTPITAVPSTSTVVLTADTAGVPFTAAASTTESDDSPADSQTFARAATTANKGANDWNTPNNWSDYTVPVASDTVIIDGRSGEEILYGLNQSSVTLARLLIYLGSPDVGTTTAPLRVSATILDVNVPPTDGSTPAGAAIINIDTGSNATTGTIYGSRDQGSDGIEPVIWKGANASNVIRVRSGNVGIATAQPGDTATLPTLQVLADPELSPPRVHVGSGVTLTTAVQQIGSAILECAVTTINQDAGTIETKGTGAVTTAYINGTAYLNSTGTITTLQVEPAGLADFTGNTAPRTISNASIHGGGRINAALPTVAGEAHALTFSSGVDCIRGAKSSQVDFGGDITVTPSAT